jgi:hypothetical protein
VRNDHDFGPKLGLQRHGQRGDREETKMDRRWIWGLGGLLVVVGFICVIRGWMQPEVGVRSVDEAQPGRPLASHVEAVGTRREVSAGLPSEMSLPRAKGRSETGTLPSSKRSTRIPTEDSSAEKGSPSELGAVPASDPAVPLPVGRPEKEAQSPKPASPSLSKGQPLPGQSVQEQAAWLADACRSELKLRWGNPTSQFPEQYAAAVESGFSKAFTRPLNPNRLASLQEALRDYVRGHLPKSVKEEEADKYIRAVEYQFHTVASAPDVSPETQRQWQKQVTRLVQTAVAALKRHAPSVSAVLLKEATDAAVAAAQRAAANPLFPAGKRPLTLEEMEKIKADVENTAQESIPHWVQPWANSTEKGTPPDPNLPHAKDILKPRPLSAEQVRLIVFLPVQSALARTITIQPSGSLGMGVAYEPTVGSFSFFVSDISREGSRVSVR